jgi:hypothetical protein
VTATPTSTFIASREAAEVLTRAPKTCTEMSTLTTSTRPATLAFTQPGSAPWTCEALATALPTAEASHAGTASALSRKVLSHERTHLFAGEHAIAIGVDPFILEQFQQPFLPLGRQRLGTR